MQTAKQSATSVIEHLHDQVSWDEIMYELYVKQKIESGLQAIAEDRSISHEEMKRQLQLKGCKI
jgi:hypothetical protein